MRSLSLLPTVLLSLTTLANAHFLFNYPPSLEGSSIDEDKEPDAPCGAKTPDLSSDTTTTDFHVDGDFISLYAGHPQFTWLYRASVQEVSEGNWTQLFPIVQQSGLGDFCSTQVTAPKEWVGKKGVVGVAGIGGDGTLFQVSFFFLPSFFSPSFLFCYLLFLVALLGSKRNKNGEEGRRRKRKRR